LTFFIVSLLLTVKLVAQQPTTPSPDKHPEKEILPFNAPCKDCIEDLSKRTAVVREFYKQEPGGGKIIYRQQSMGAMNYKDENGYWRTIDPMLKEEGVHVFAAR